MARVVSGVGLSICALMAFVALTGRRNLQAISYYRQYLSEEHLDIPGTPSSPEAASQQGNPSSTTEVQEFQLKNRIDTPQLQAPEKEQIKSLQKPLKETATRNNGMRNPQKTAADKAKKASHDVRNLKRDIDKIRSYSNRTASHFRPSSGPTKGGPSAPTASPTRSPTNSPTHSPTTSQSKELKQKREKADLEYSSLQSGVLQGHPSNKSWEFFQKIRDKIDQEPWQERCGRWIKANKRVFKRSKDTTPKNRRIFYGSLIADEPWELLEIMGAETYGIFEGMVFVESNRTQNFDPRPFLHNQHTQKKLQSIFGVPQLEIRQYINEDPQLKGLQREHTQRQEILKAWKDMGMGPEDIGYITDVDEAFTRDFLRAVQVCPYVKPFDYESHRCHHSEGRLKAGTRVFEGSPQCLTKDRFWFHPDMVIGACLEEVGNATEHPRALRNGYRRQPGYGGSGHEIVGSKEHKFQYANITGDHYPLWSAGDLRMLNGGHGVGDAAFHLHNWFPDFERIRNKYKTYGHPVKNALTLPVHGIHNDLKMMVYCLQDLTDAPKKKDQMNSPYGSKWQETQDFHRLVGGYESSPKHWPKPIYFSDEDYRQRKHEAAQAKLREDNEQRLALLEPHEREKEAVEEALMEAKRQMWAYQQQGKEKKIRDSQLRVDALKRELLKPHEREKEAVEEALMEAKRQMWAHQQQGNKKQIRASQLRIDALKRELLNLGQQATTRKNGKKTHQKTQTAFEGAK